MRAYQGGRVAARQRYRQTEHGRYMAWFQNLKYYAKKRGIEFDLQLYDIQIPSRCPVLGLELDWQTGKKTYNSISLDRKDNSKGYVKENVFIISERANRLKSDATYEEICTLERYMAPKITIENIRVREEQC